MDSPLPQTKKSLGQHWLRDSVILEAMCVGADIQHGDAVLEVGPGTGTLTKKLLQRSAHVYAVELDESLETNLKKSFAGQYFDLYIGSILEFDFNVLPEGYKLVANIPYYLTNHLLRLISETSHPPLRAALLVQKEVAERVAAEPGQMSLLSVTTQFYWQVELGSIVPAELFSPPPKIDSQILLLTRRPKTLFEVDEKKFFQIVKAGFSARRKKLRSSLSGGLGLDKKTAENYLQSADIDPNKRAQELSLEDWHRIYVSLQ